jgi:hypothetical protein
MPRSSGIVITACCAMLTAVSSTFAAECPRAGAVPNFEPSSGPALRLFGTVQQVQGNNLVIATRNGQHVTVDATPALSAQLSPPLAPGRTLDILGTQGPQGEIRADVIRRAPSAPSAWEADCMP